MDYYYFVVDCSGSMTGRKLGAVNDAINNIVHRLKRFTLSRGINAKVILLSFADEPNWSNVVPIDIKEFTYSDLMIGGLDSNITKALVQLGEKLTRQVEVDRNSANSTTILFFTDGLFTEEIEKTMEVINVNPVFLHSTRIGMTFDDELSLDIALRNLSRLVGGEENIIVGDFVGLNKKIFDKYG